MFFLCFRFYFAVFMVSYENDWNVVVVKFNFYVCWENMNFSVLNVFNVFFKYDVLVFGYEMVILVYVLDVFDGGFYYVSAFAFASKILGEI